MTGLLLKIAPYRTEGPYGYLLRLAQTNLLRISDLAEFDIIYDDEVLNRNGLLPPQEIDPVLTNWVSSVTELRQKAPRVWNAKHARFCPKCLQEDPSWHAEWEVYFYDACAKHGTWMVDQCSSCGQAVNWHRDQLLRCPCGSDQQTESTTPAPNEVTALSRVIAQKLFKSGENSTPVPLRGLSLDQTQRLVRYLGMHLNPAGMPKSLKLFNAGLMRVSWNVTTTAAAILANWPTAFQARFTALQDINADDTKAGLSKMFRRAYSHLYRGLKEPEFELVRLAFEQWLTENWKGGLAIRNRRLQEELVQKVRWIPATKAAARLGVRAKRIRHLVTQGLLDGSESVSHTGRHFLLVRRDQVEALDQRDITEVNLSAAMELLGLGKVRLRELVRLLFPTAYRPASEHGYPPWRINRTEVETYLEIGADRPILQSLEEHQVALSHVLKHWAWDTDEIIDLIEDVRDGKVPLEGLLDGAPGLARWLFNAQALKLWRHGRASGQSNWLSVPRLAKVLGVKQEVAYWLVRNDFIHGEKLRPQRGAGTRVSALELLRFRQNYVFATEIADALKTTSRKAGDFLAVQGIYAVSGRGIEKCGKIFYARTEALTQALADIGVALK